MQVKLNSSNYNHVHTFNIIVRDKELVLTTPKGDEIASICVETMEMDVQNDERKYRTVPTKNFFVSFSPAENTCGKDVGHAWVELDPKPVSV